MMSLFLSCIVYSGTNLFAGIVQEQTKVSDEKQQRPQGDKPKAEKKAFQERARINAEDAMIAELEGMFSEQFRPIVRGELFFIRTLCHPTKEQYEQIAAATEDVQKAAVKKYAEARKAMMRGQNRTAAALPDPDPRQLISEALNKTVVEVMSAEQAATYKEQIEKRAAHRKRVTILNFVARLDRDLMLDADQRDKVKEILTNKWNDDWSQSLEMMAFDQPLPILPDKDIQSILNVSQKTVWREMGRSQARVFGWVGHMDLLTDLSLEEDLWEPDGKTNAQTSGKQGVNR